VCLGKALAELEIRLLAVGLLKQLTLELEANQDLTLKIIPSPSPADGLLVRADSRANEEAAEIDCFSLPPPSLSRHCIDADRPGPSP
jgi:hypothetical protein